MTGTHGITETEGTEISQLVASEVHEQKPATIAKGEDLVRGAVMGLVTSELRIDHGTVTGGPFQADETITGGTSAATATVDVVGDGFLDVSAVSGTFQDDETIQGGTSSASATVTSTVAEQYKYKELDPDDGNGTEDARAILAENADASSADVIAEIFLTGKYRLSDLVWPDGISDADKNAALLQLQDRGIVVDADFV
jgi:hypothetical protein